MKLIIDCHDFKPVDDMPTGTVTFMSFQRMLAGLMWRGEFGDDETVTHIEITERGLTFRVKCD